MNWKTQIRKGYLELCLLAMIARHGRIYGFDLIEMLKAENLEIKEGTLYPLLNRMTAEGLLSAHWETEAAKGHPRKYYSLSKEGREIFKSMEDEFVRLYHVFQKLNIKTNLQENNESIQEEREK